MKAIAVDEGPQDAIEPGEASPQLLPEAKNGVSLDDVGRHAPTAAPRDGSKLALIIELLERANGASIVDLTQATGWLAHTTRAAITGLRKRGYAVTRERSDAGEFVYRISGAPPDEPSARRSESATRLYREDLTLVRHRDFASSTVIWETDFRGTETRGRIRGQGATKPLKWPPQTSL